MIDSLPFTNQRYNDSVFKIAVYKLVDQEPGLVNLILDNITSKLPGRATPSLFKDILPMSENTLLMTEITIHYPYKKKVTYYWICKKLIQLLLWTEGRCAINLDGTLENYKFSFKEISENILKLQQIMSDYASHSACKSKLLESDKPYSTESTILPSYKNAIADRDIVGTSNAHLTPPVLKNIYISKSNERSVGHSSNSSLSDNKLSYLFNGYNRLQARSFLNDFTGLVLRNEWSSEQKIKSFKDHLEKDALEWYLSYNIRSLRSWKALKNEFVRKYLG